MTSRDLLVLLLMLMCYAIGFFSGLEISRRRCDVNPGSHLSLLRDVRLPALNGTAVLPAATQPPPTARRRTSGKMLSARNRCKTGHTCWCSASKIQAARSSRHQGARHQAAPGECSRCSRQRHSVALRGGVCCRARMPSIHLARLQPQERPLDARPGPLFTTPHVSASHDLNSSSLKI